MIKMKLGRSSKSVMRIGLTIFSTMLIVSLVYRPTLTQIALADEAVESHQGQQLAYIPNLCDPLCGPGRTGSGSKDGSTVYSDIYGMVTDLTTGQPNTSVLVLVRVNEVLLRTDTLGTFSLTGLKAGTFEVSLELPAGYTAAQPVQTITLGDGARASVDLQYYSGPVPAATPELPASSPSPAGEANQAVEPAEPTSSSCAEVYVVQADDWLSKLAERFLGDVLAYDQIVTATTTARTQDLAFANISDPNLIEPGFQLCIPSK